MMNRMWMARTMPKTRAISPMMIKSQQPFVSVLAPWAPYPWTRQIGVPLGGRRPGHGRFAVIRETVSGSGPVQQRGPFDIDVVSAYGMCQRKGEHTMASDQENRHEYQPASTVGNPCEVCGFGRHHPWHQ